jgi:hypothetical protein
MICIEEDITFKLVRVVGRVLKNSLFTFCVVNTLVTVVGFPACIYGKSMQVPVRYRTCAEYAKFFLLGRQKIVIAFCSLTALI